MLFWKLYPYEARKYPWPSSEPATLLETGLRYILRVLRKFLEQLSYKNFVENFLSSVTSIYS